MKAAVLYKPGNVEGVDKGLALVRTCTLKDSLSALLNAVLFVLWEYFRNNNDTAQTIGDTKTLNIACVT